MDWSPISMQDFDAVVLGAITPRAAVSHALIDRLPWIFETKEQYLRWRDGLADGLGVDGRDVILVGSAATGRSLNPGKRWKVFHSKSDLDIAVVSAFHFDLAWRWFQESDPLLLTGLDEIGQSKFKAHRNHYIFEGVIAAEYFLSYLPFAQPWLESLRRSSELLPAKAQGRYMRIRIYRDARSLRLAQQESMRLYMAYLKNKQENREAGAP